MMFACRNSFARKLITTRAKNNGPDHSVFQLNNKSPFISVKDVKEAFEMTRYMSSYERLRYFRKMGIHYKRSNEYLNMIEQFEETLKASKSMEQPLSQGEEDLAFMTVDIIYPDEDERFPIDSTEQLGQMIADVARSKEKESLKTNEDNLFDKNMVSNGLQALLSITAIFTTMIMIKYIVEMHH